MGKYVRLPQEGAEGEYGGRVYPEIKARDAAWILVGPGRKWAEFELGNIDSTRLQLVVINYTPAHDHDHTHEQPDEEQAYYIVAGGAVVTAGTAKILMRPRSGVFVPRGLLHGFKNERDETLTILDIHTYFWDDVRPGKLFIEDPILPKGAVRATHSHTDREEVYYVHSGRVEVWVNDEEAVLRPGSVVFIPRGARHGWRNVGDGALELVAVSSRDM